MTNMTKNFLYKFFWSCSKNKVYCCKKVGHVQQILVMSIWSSEDSSYFFHFPTDILYFIAKKFFLFAFVGLLTLREVNSYPSSLSMDRVR